MLPYLLTFIFILNFDIIYSLNNISSCPCSNISLCDNIKIIHDKELMGTTLGTINYTQFNWTYLTTIKNAPINDTELLCYAHSKNVRLTIGTSWNEKWNVSETPYLANHVGADPYLAYPPTGMNVSDVV